MGKKAKKKTRGSNALRDLHVGAAYKRRKGSQLDIRKIELKEPVYQIHPFECDVPILWKSVPSSERLAHGRFGNLLAVFFWGGRGSKVQLVSLDKLINRMGEIDYRTLTHSSALEKLEADVDFLKRGERAVLRAEALPSYVNKELEKLSESIGGLTDAGGDKGRVLYYITEVEAILGKLEEKARVTNKKYEGRLAGCLRDVCWVNEPSELSVEQIGRFCACLKALVGGWGKLSRDKLKWICERLLEVELTWLPVTDKVAKETAEEPKSGQ